MGTAKEGMLAEIELFIRYGVPEEDQPVARQLAHIYRDNPLLLGLLHEHYSTLPDACEEAVTGVAELARQQGVHLLVVVTNSRAFLYAVSVDAVVFLAPYRTELDEELLTYFGFADQAAYLAACPLMAALLPPVPAGAEALPGRCPVCGVVAGEEHLLGCSLEICPWCDGQLSKCNCRFSQLGSEEIDEESLARFAELLQAKGRIVFTADQLPTYPGTSQGLDRRQVRRP